MKRYDAHATFFVIGEQARLFPEIVRDLVKAGNEIGNHAFSTRKTAAVMPRGCSTRSPGPTTRSIKRPGFFRLFSVPLWIRQELGGGCLVSTGMKLVLWTWDEDPQDLTCPDAGQIVDKVLTYARPGSIVIFHDCGGDRTQTVAALPEILEGLAVRGLHPVTVSELPDHDRYTPRPVHQSVEWWNLTE